MRMMDAIVKPAAAPGLELRQVPVPTPGAGEVLIKVHKTAICGTDVHIYDWNEWSAQHVKPPMVIGHEYVGEIAELGAGVTGLTVGQRVSGEGHITCGHCRNCHTGNIQWCKNTTSVGVDRDGAFAEYVCIPARNVVLIDPALDEDVVAMFDAVGNATHTALMFNLVGEDVLITGAGPVGILAVAIAKYAGARRVVVTDLNDYRLGLALKMGADAAIAVVSASALAVGVVVTSLTTGMTTDVDSFMFGSILAMDRADVALSVGLCAAVLVLYVLFYHRLFAITFDESFARATGVKVGLYNTILSVLTALTIVLGMRMMGAMLISSLVIFPALTAMGLLRSFRGVVLCAAGLSVVCFCIGLTGSYLWGTPVGATVVLVNLAAFLLSRGVMRIKRAA